MTEKTFNARSPGDMLRAAREKQGLHIAALAAAIKVAPRKLDALEHDRWDELPDATFVRALAQTVCRTLKIDPVPVMELLPRAGALPLAPDSGGLNTPFRERPGRDEPGLAAGAVRPMVIAAGVLMLAAVAIYFVPDRYWPGKGSASLAASSPSGVGATSVAAAPASASSTAEGALPVAASAPELSIAAADPILVAASAPAAASAAATAVQAGAVNATAAPGQGTVPVAEGGAIGLVMVRAHGASWVEARDASGKVLVSRLVAAGENLALDGRFPLRMTIGNASAAELEFRGQPFDLKPLTRDNVARFELK